MKKVLITGGAGYIGSKISYDLTDLGYKVYIIDNLVTGNLKLLNPKAKFFKISILEKKKIRNIVKKNNIKIIIHCAALMSVEESNLKKKKYYTNNVLGTKKLLEATTDLIDIIIFSSTCAVYDTFNNPIVTPNSKTGPISYYGKTKLMGEKIIKETALKKRIKFGILRYFNVAGSDELLRTGCINNNNQLIKNLSRNIVKNNYKIDLYGNDYNTPDGTCIRDYIHVSDLSKLHIYVMNYLKKNKSLTLNCGYGKGYSVLEIITLFEKIIKKKISIQIKKKRIGDIAQIFSSNKCLNNKIKIKFKTLRQILQSSIDWEKKINEKK